MPRTNREEQPVAVAAPTIDLVHVSHRFGHRIVFHDINLHVAAGQVAVVTGDNGAGKSTLLRIIAGLLKLQSGSVGVTVCGAIQDALARRRYLGYVAPDLVLYRELSGVENLEFFAGLRGITLTHELLKLSLQRVGLLGRGRDLVGSYSSGMRQRLKYAFALIGCPPILLLDEPTANLDSGGIDMVRQIVHGQRERVGGGLTVIATNEPREHSWGDVTVQLNGILTS